MDIIIEDAPDTVTLQQEQYDELVKIIGSGLEMNDPRMKLLIRGSQLRNKAELLEMIDGGDEPTDEQKFAQQIELETLQKNLEKLTAEVEKINSETEKNRADGVKTITEVDAMDGVIDGSIGPPELTGPQ